MGEVTYQAGATEVWSDGEKIIVKNPTGMEFIKVNFDTIFGEGEYDKMYEVKYFHNTTPGKLNTLSKSEEICSGYIPRKVKEDLGEQGLPGMGEKEYSKYFKRTDEE